MNSIATASPLYRASIWPLDRKLTEARWGRQTRLNGKLMLTSADSSADDISPATLTSSFDSTQANTTYMRTTTSGRRQSIIYYYINFTANRPMRSSHFAFRRTDSECVCRLHLPAASWFATCNHLSAGLFLFSCIKRIFATD